jgi:uncharacterized membrane protein
MFYAFRGQIGDKRSFYASLFFIVMPVYNLQLAQIAKSMVAELFFAVAVLALVSTWRTGYKVSVITACTVLAIVSHYTIGLALLAYLFGILVIRVITSRLRCKLWRLRRTPVVVLLVVLLAGAGSFYTYYHFAYGGTVNRVVSGIGKWYSGNATVYTGDIVELVTTPITPVVDTVTEDVNTTTENVTATDNHNSYLYNQEYTVQMGIGLDFLDQPIEGKLFRIVQYLTQLLIIIGSIRLLLYHRKYRFSSEFIAGVGCSFLLLLTCIFVPQFSFILNMPRFYQISLFFLAPMLVIGCDAVSGIPLLTRKILTKKQEDDR